MHRVFRCLRREGDGEEREQREAEGDTEESHNAHLIRERRTPAPRPRTNRPASWRREGRFCNAGCAASFCSSARIVAVALSRNAAQSLFISVQASNAASVRATNSLTRIV